MSNENYVNYYVEIMGGTLQESILKNISLQANARISNEIIESYSKQLDEAKSTIDALNKHLEETKKSINADKDAIVNSLHLEIQQKNNEINQLNQNHKEQLDALNKHLEETKKSINTDKDAIVNSLHLEIQQKNNEINQLNNKQSDYENVKHQVQHIETFRNELAKERELHKKTQSNYEKQIDELNKKIEKLKPTPAKKVKNEEVLVEKTNTTKKIVEENTIIKDGGSF